MPELAVAIPAGLTTLGAGIITVINWTMCADGETYLYLFCSDWRIITDAQVPVEKFRSSEKWSLLGVRADGEAGVIIPGCQVKGLARCEEHPERSTIFEVK